MAEMSEEEIRRVRGKDIAMIYQEPMASLNPSLTIGQQLMEVPMVHEGVSRAEAFERAYDMLAAVHIPDPKRLMISYPHQVSGGQQQRVVIAMALLSQPALLLLDEPTTALDVTVEAGIVELIAELSRKTGSSLLYISHNLGLMLEVCDRICVMYSGEVVEEGTIDSIFSWPKHPYTQGLFGCIPLPHADKNARPLVSIKGQLPLPHERPEGCNFGPRCGFFEATGAATGPDPDGGGAHRRRSRASGPLYALGRDRRHRSGARRRERASRSRLARPSSRSPTCASTTRCATVRWRRWSRAARCARSRRTRASASAPARARRSPSWANPAAASPPSPRC